FRRVLFRSILYEMLTALNRFANTHALEGGSPSSADLDAIQRAALMMKELTDILGIFQSPRKVKQYVITAEGGIGLMGHASVLAQTKSHDDLFDELKPLLNEAQGKI